MFTTGKRLREERERLGFSQLELGEAGGVHKRSQINYESGERKPDAEYLAKVFAIGVDVQYVVTGKRARGKDWIDMLELIIDELREADLWLPGAKVTELADLLSDMADQGADIGPEQVKRHLKLVA